MTPPLASKDRRFGKIETAYRFSFFAIATLLLFTLFNVRFGFHRIAVAELVAAMLWVAMVMLHQRGKITKDTVYHSMISIGFVVFYILFYEGGYGNAGIFWMLGFPFLAYFFAGSRGGSYWSIAYIATFFIIESLVNHSPLFVLPYDSETIRLIPSTLFVFSGLAYFYETHREEAVNSERQALLTLRKEVQQHRQDEHALLASQERIRGMMSDMREAMFKLNTDGNIELVSPAIQQITQFTQEQVLDMALIDLFANAEDKQNFSQQIHHYGQVRNFKVEFKAANKQRVFVSIYAKLDHDEHGQVTGIEGIISDHTLVQQSENAMSLLIYQLRKARDTARASNQEKTKFLSLVSHELRTPIHGLMGMQEMLMMDKQGLTQEQQDYLAASQQATLAISHLIHDMISMADEQPAQVGKRTDEIELAPFLCEVMNYHSHLVKEKELTFALALADVPSAIAVNVGKLRQVVFNLLSYAIKGAVAGGVRLGVSVEHARLCFKVSYIHAAKGVQLQNQASLKDSSLEMMIIYGCLEKLGGSLQMETLGRATTMTFEMVMVSSSEPLMNLSIQGDQSCQIQLVASKKQGKQAPNNQGLRILLAEDDKISRMIALKRLKRAGFDVLAVNDGLQAWQALQHDHFDLLLTDIRMPALDGLALTKKIREQEQGTAKHLHILGLSAHALQTHIDEYLAAGMDNFLSKPIEPSQLLMHIPDAQEVA